MGLVALFLTSSSAFCDEPSPDSLPYKTILVGPSGAPPLTPSTPKSSALMKVDQLILQALTEIDPSMAAPKKKLRDNRIHPRMNETTSANGNAIDAEMKTRLSESEKILNKRGIEAKDIENLQTTITYLDRKKNSTFTFQSLPIARAKHLLIARTALLMRDFINQIKTDLKNRDPNRYQKEKEHLVKLSDHYETIAGQLTRLSNEHRRASLEGTKNSEPSRSQIKNISSDLYQLTEKANEGYLLTEAFQKGAQDRSLAGASCLQGQNQIAKLIDPFSVVLDLSVTLDQFFLNLSQNQLNQISSINITKTNLKSKEAELNQLLPDAKLKDLWSRIHTLAIPFTDQELKHQLNKLRNRSTPTGDDSADEAPLSLNQFITYLEKSTVKSTHTESTSPQMKSRDTLISLLKQVEQQEQLKNDLRRVQPLKQLDEFEYFRALKRIDPKISKLTGELTQLEINLQEQIQKELKEKGNPFAVYLSTYEKSHSGDKNRRPLTNPPSPRSLTPSSN